MDASYKSPPSAWQGSFLETRKALITILLVLGSACFGFATGHRAEAFTRAFGPKAVVNVARPTLVWEVWAGDGSHISDAHMTLDGCAVKPSYDVDTHSLRYTPNSRLNVGPHHVDCQVMIDDSLPVHREWDFIIPERAPELVPTASNDQRQLIDIISEYRTDMGLESFVSDDRLAAAAAAHTAFLERNNITGHQETPGKPGFVGTWPIDRLESFGFLEDSWECVDYGGKDGSDCIRDLFDAPYHRIPFMQPGQLLCGASYVDSHLTVEFEMTKQTATTVSPYPGQQDVQPSWDSHERPDPLRMHSTSGPVGYPIVLSHFSPGNERIVLRSAKLQTEDGEDVPIFSNSPANDDKLNFTVFVISQRPLRPYTTYRVTVSASTAAGEDASKSWCFTTGAGPASVRHLQARR